MSSSSRVWRAFGAGTDRRIPALIEWFWVLLLTVTFSDYRAPIDADRLLIVFRDFSSRVVWSVGRLLHLVCDFGFRVVDYILPFARFLVILDAGYLVIDYWFECDS